MPELPLDVAVANRFISSLSKSLQALCHGCMDFDSGIEIVGYINVNIDCGSKVDYVLNEKVLKSTTNSMTFVSNSFLAKKDQPKQTRDGSCSPVAELQVQSFPSSSRHRGAHPYPGALHHRSAFPYSQTHALRGAQKRAWSGMERDWRASPRKHSRGGRGSYPLPHEQPYGGSSSHTSSFETQSSQVPSTSDSSFLQPEIPVSNSGVNIKKELFDSEDQSGAGQSEAGVAGESEGGNGDSSLDSKLNIKADPDAVPESEGDPSAGPSEDANTDLKDTFLQQSGEDAEQPEPGDSAQDAEGEFPSFDMAQSESAADNGQTMSEDTTAGAEQTDDNVTAENSEAPAEYDEAGDDMSYRQSSYAEQGEGSGDGGQFEVIEIDDEDEDVQAMFGDARVRMKLKLSTHDLNQPWEPESTQPGAASGLQLDQWPQGAPSQDNLLEALAEEPQGFGDYACPYCPTRSQTVSQQRQHMNVSHPHLMPYMCTICSRGFSSYGGYHSHKMTHTGRTFVCPICDNTFLHKHHLKRHLRNVHKLMWCLKCTQTFPVGEEFSQHVLVCGE